MTREQLVGAALVRASVQKIDGSDLQRNLQVTFEVCEILAGCGCDVGEQFVVDVSRDGQSLSGLPAFFPPLEKCQVVLWLIERVNGDLVRSFNPGSMGLRRYAHGGIGGALTRESKSDQSQSLAIEFGTAVRSVSHADSTQRWELLQALCMDPNCRVAGWAMSVLASVDKDAAQPFLQQLAAEHTLPEKQQEMIQDLLRQLADE